MRNGLYDLSIPAMALILAVVAIIGSMSVAVFHKPDNPVEEVCEEIIKDETGLSIDLTPSSPEVQALPSK